MRKKGKYSPEFKEQAVKRSLSGSFTIKELAESLGISYYVLRDWKKKYYKDFSIKSMAEALEVSREAYYKSLRIKDQIKKEKEIILKDAIYKIWEDSLMIYGLRRILEEAKKIYPEVGKRILNLKYLLLTQIII